MSSPVRISSGTTENAYVNRSFVPSPCKKTKTSTFSTISTYVTYGVLVRPVLSSPTGNTIVTYS
jgi:hypothetical protein